MTDFTPQPELQQEFETVVDDLNLRGKLRMQMSVLRIEDPREEKSGEPTRVFCERTGGGDNSSVCCFEARKAVLLCTGGLQVPRRLSFPGEQAFGGPVIYGLNQEIDKLDLRGKRVCI